MYYDPLESISKNKEKKHSMNKSINDEDSTTLYVGQKLFCSNGEEVFICELKENEIIVEYNKRKYSRNKNIIGKKLFFNSPLKDSRVNFQKNIKNSIIHNQKVPKASEKERKILKFYESELVKHNSFGIGTIVKNNGMIIKVLFHNGKTLDFSYESCLKERILMVLSDNKFSNISLIELKKISDDLFNKKEYNYFALNINSEIIEKDPSNLKYLLRLAECYKNHNSIEESIIIYKKILQIDRNNSIAKDNLEIYRNGGFYKPKDKIFDGTWRDVYQPQSIDEEDFEKLSNIFK